RDSEQHECDRAHERGRFNERTKTSLPIHCVPPVGFETAHGLAEELFAYYRERQLGAGCTIRDDMHCSGNL
ncbi:MAG: hypothetical protein WBP90_08645, partial [Terracidiphilus sp.]